MNKIVITGTKGFIGSNLYKHLSKEYSIIEINEDIFEHDYREILQNIFFNDVIKGVFHVGACSDTLETNVNYMMLVNYEFTKLLSELCDAFAVPLMYSSSAANYGENNYHPSNLYGWSKYVAEDSVIKRSGIALRYFNVYGPGEENKGKMSSVAYQMFMKNKNGEKPMLFPNNPRRDFVYVKDIISANLFAFENYTSLCGYYYDVGCGTARSFEDVLDLMDIEYGYHHESLIPKGYQYYTCSMKDNWMKGWEPKYQLEEGINDYLLYLNEY